MSDHTTVVVQQEAGPTIIIQPGSGPPGPPGGGPGGGGSGTPGQPRFTGQGPPPVYIPGAVLGDLYLNTLTGDLYKLT
jgi:hypothetical protein